MTRKNRNNLLTEEHFIRAAQLINSTDNLKSLVSAIPEILNVKIMSYHHFPAAGSSDYRNLSQYFAHGVPQDILDYFDRNIKQRDDPGIIAAHQKGQFIWLSDMPLQPYVIEKNAQERYRRTFERIGEGLSIPLYGPGNRKGCIFVAVNGSLKESSAIFPYNMQALAQLIHIRYCLLTDKMQKHAKLTAREAEVLELITFGKSNVDIGLILNISPNTVAVYVKRIFIKLDVSDRVSAAMRAHTIKSAL